jgi:sugar lactone lactonase YvrE
MPNKFLIAGAAGAAAVFCGWTLVHAADVAPNSQPNPYKMVEKWYQLPEGRTMGSSSAVDIDSKGHIWVAERCGGNSCAGKDDIDPILEFDPSGKLLKSFGKGMFLFPHGICIDKQDNIWITDEQSRDGKGNVAVKFSPEGKVLMTLGVAGSNSDAEDALNQPNDVAIAPNGDIFVGNGHSEHTGPAKMLKFDKNGKFLKSWGGHGSGPGQFEMPHSLAFDSKGRLFVADRGNNRIQIFDQDGKYITEWKQFGRPSGIFIDKHDNLYAADSESQPVETKGKMAGYGFNPGFNRGLRVGSAKTGVVVAFISDPPTDSILDRPRPITSNAEGIAADSHGNIYGAEVGPKDVKKYVKK